jgi:hypothetical protein
MNERIRELVEQAVVAIDIVTGNEALDDELAKMYIPDCFAEKFTELIVRECLGVMDATSKRALEQQTYQGDDVPTVRHQIEIKKHFGVEE